MVTTFSFTAPHIDDLPNSDIDTLLDLHLFGFDAWCHEHCLVTRGGAIAACIACGYFEELRMAGAHFDPSAAHPRNVPRYTEKDKVWRVIEKIKEVCNVQTKIRFELMLQAQYHCNILSLTSRMIGVAALQAIGTIDDSGYIVVEEEDSEAQHG
jgi:hypothetical protein